MTSEQARAILEDYRARRATFDEATQAWRDLIRQCHAEPMRTDLIGATAAARTVYATAKARYLEIEDSGDLYKARDRARRDNITRPEVGDEQ